MSATQITKISHRHHAIIDWLLANPSIKNLTVLCDDMNVSRSWLSVVMNTDAFRNEFERRRLEVDDGLQRDLIRVSFQASIKANERLLDYMDEAVDKLDPRILLDTANATADRMYGPKSVGGTQLKETVTEFVLDNGMLQEARQRIREVNSNETQTLPAPSDIKYIDS